MPPRYLTNINNKNSSMNKIQPLKSTLVCTLGLNLFSFASFQKDTALVKKILKIIATRYNYKIASLNILSISDHCFCFFNCNFWNRIGTKLLSNSLQYLSFLF